MDYEVRTNWVILTINADQPELADFSEFLSSLEQSAKFQAVITDGLISEIAKNNSLRQFI